MDRSIDLIEAGQEKAYQIWTDFEAEKYSSYLELQLILVYVNRIYICLMTLDKRMSSDLSSCSQFLDFVDAVTLDIESKRELNSDDIAAKLAQISKSSNKFIEFLESEYSQIYGIWPGFTFLNLCRRKYNRWHRG